MEQLFWGDAGFGLKAIVVHIGDTRTLGHYLTYKRRPDGRWLKCNDAAVQLSLNFEEVVVDIAATDGASPYLLFYDMVAENGSAGNKEHRAPVLVAQIDSVNSVIHAATSLRYSLLRGMFAQEKNIFDEFAALPQTQQEKDRIVLAGNTQLWKTDVTVGDIQSLISGIWVCGTALNAYLQLVRDEWIRCKDGHGKILILNSFWWAKVKDMPERAARMLNKEYKLWYPDEEEKECWGNVETIYFPIHWPAHWSCGKIDISALRFEHFDSIFDEGRAQQFFDGCIDVIGSVGSRESGWDSWKFDKHKETYEKQSNTVDCGVWTSQCILWQVLGVTPDFKEQDMERFREKMIVSLARGRILR